MRAKLRVENEAAWLEHFRSGEDRPEDRGREDNEREDDASASIPTGCRQHGKGSRTVK